MTSKHSKTGRANQAGRTIGDPKHVRLYWWLLECEAWKSLKLCARALLVELYKLHNGTNNGELFLSIRDAARILRVAPNTAGKAFHELENKGFIRAHQRGSFKWKTRHATTWILTEYDYANQTRTREFMSWNAAKIKNSALPSKPDGTKP